MNIAKKLNAITGLIKVLEKSANPDRQLIAELHIAARELVNMDAPIEHNSFTCACVNASH